MARTDVGRSLKVLRKRNWLIYRDFLASNRARFIPGTSRPSVRRQPPKKMKIGLTQTGKFDNLEKFALNRLDDAMNRKCNVRNEFGDTQA